MANITNDAKNLAQTTLQVLLEDELPEEKWREIEAQLHELERALGEDNADAFRKARKAVEHLRMGCAGEAPKNLPKKPIPSHIRDYINHIIVTLQPSGNRPPAQPNQEKTPNASD